MKHTISYKATVHRAAIESGEKLVRIDERLKDEFRAKVDVCEGDGLDAVAEINPDDVGSLREEYTDLRFAPFSPISAFPNRWFVS